MISTGGLIPRRWSELTEKTEKYGKKEKGGKASCLMISLD